MYSGLNFKITASALFLLSSSIPRSQAFSITAAASSINLSGVKSTPTPRNVHTAGLRMMSTKSEEEWRAVLSPAQFRVLRQKATEPPGSSEFNKLYTKEGSFDCVGCGTPLYRAEAKFDSGCGWPAFYEGYPGAIKEIPDADGMRTEIVCNACGGHLGHVFKNEGFPNPTNERHCVNGITLKYTKA